MVKDGRHHWRFAALAAQRTTEDWGIAPRRTNRTWTPIRWPGTTTHPITSSFNSNDSVGTLFEPVSVNMVSAQPEPNDDEIELTDNGDDPWIRHLNMLWDIRFEQCEPPTDDALLQVNMGDEANPKPIYISNALSLKEKDDLIALIRQYIDVFSWHYEDMPGLDPKVAIVIS